MRIRADFGRSALQGFVSSSLWLTTVGGGPCRADISRLDAEVSSVGSQLPTISENDGPARNTKTFRGSDQVIAAGPPARVQRRIADTVSTQAGSMRPGRPK